VVGKGTGAVQVCTPSQGSSEPWFYLQYSDCTESNRFCLFLWHISAPGLFTMTKKQPALRVQKDAAEELGDLITS